MNKRNILLLTIALIAIVGIIVLMFFLGNKKQINANNPEFSKYVSAYSSGIISKSSGIKIRFVSTIAEKVQAMNPMPENLFEISPKIKGTVTWADATTLEFKPSEFLKSGEKYFVSFKLNEVADVPGDLKNFCFNVFTINQNFDVSIDEQRTIDRKNLSLQKIIGTLRIADFEKFGDVQKIISAAHNSNKMKIKWSADSVNKTYTFEIDSIPRTETSSEIELLCDGTPIGIDKSEKINIEIPDKNKFSYLRTKTIQQPEQCIILQFSDPLKETQDLNGLITIKGSAYPRFIIDDNTVKIYPSTKLQGDYAVTIEPGVKNILDKKFDENKVVNVLFEDVKPAIRAVNKGVILPSSDKGMIFPFEAVNLKAVDVQIIKIFENNVIQFLQVNDFNGSQELRRVGRPILNKTIFLNENGIVDFGKWNRFSLDLNEMIKTEPGAIYRINISFKKEYSLYNCGTDEVASTESNMKETENWNQAEGETTNWDSWGDYYDNDYYYYYDWENRDNPCHPSYYSSDKKIAQNIIASNLGIIAKKANNGSLSVFVSDLLTAEPMKDVQVNLYNYQNQVIKTITTNSDGLSYFEKADNPYFIVAKHGDQNGYLKIADGTSLSLSRFEVGGTEVSKGLKGFIYGERGVWRPGDSIYLTFILKEENTDLPKDHPVIFELKNVKGQLVKKEIQNKNNTNFYTFACATSPDAPTGDWTASVTIGSVYFYKSLKVETIKPNRLKIALDFKQKFLEVGKDLVADMKVKWLQGIAAKDMDVNVQMKLSEATLSFQKYADYTFDDVTKNFYSEAQEIYEGKTDEQGIAKLETSLESPENAPGKLNATFVTKVFEKGGNFSIDQFTIPYYSYSSFVGIKTPKGDKSRGMLLTDTAHLIEIALVDVNGNPVNKNHKLKLDFYKLEWKWWWDFGYDESLSNFETQNSSDLLKSETLTSSGSTASWKIKVSYPDWGRYLVRASDLTSGHTSSKIVYIDWPGWAGRPQSESEGASMLSFSTDKSVYNVGEKVTVSIPTGAKGKALICIENGSKVIESHWIDAKSPESTFSFKATKEMTPNVYINVSLLQPHAQTMNDLPIRMYGIVPVKVENPETHLNPEIKMPDVIQAESDVKITVSEKNNQEMTYTLAIVDEGLLDLTRFKTPDPWETFYAKEAIGVKTWDLYSHVIGAYGAELERLLSIGGDEGPDGDKSQRANRFKPMVKFIGPFTLKKGSNTHTVKMPKYIGSVRTMVIAGNPTGAYGSTEKATPVIKPLMVLGTLPRVLSPGEKLKLPVSVFAMDKNVKNATIQLKANDLIKINGSSQKSVTFTEIGEKYIDFDITVNSLIGVGKIELIATSGSEKSVYEIELDIRVPNPSITKVNTKILNNNELWNADFLPFGVKGTNKVTLEMSIVPPINLEKRLKYLINYPYGCIEQTTSSAFPQLYVSNFIEIPAEQKDMIDRNIKAALKRLTQFQNGTGGFAYWPGGSDVNEWGTSYAGHFMLEAEKYGYTLPQGLLNNWKNFQKARAKAWTNSGDQYQLMQSYRLYTLALANSPELGEMNRMKELKNLDNEAKWYLASAYYLAGKSEIANNLIAGLPTSIPEYTDMYYTYGSAERDKAIILETLVLLNRNKAAFEILKEISEKLATDNWYSTQTTAYTLMAISKYYEKNKTTNQIKFAYTLNGKTQNVTSIKNISLTDIPANDAKTLKLDIKNTSGGVLYARIITSGIPEVDETQDADNGISMELAYKSIDGQIISPENIEQGNDFYAIVKVTNNGQKGDLRNLSLSQIFPSGWEIINARMTGGEDYYYTSVPTYQDVRDDRIYTFFDLPVNQSKTFKVMLNASYAGNYYLPAVYCEAMYDATINCVRKGGKIEVTAQN